MPGEFLIARNPEPDSRLPYLLRALAEEWTYRFLAAAHVHADDDRHAAIRTDDQLDITGPAAPEPSTAEIRTWARSAGLPVSDRGRLRPEVITAYRSAHATPVDQL